MPQELLELFTYKLHNKVALDQKEFRWSVIGLYCTTVDGRNPAPVDIMEIFRESTIIYRVLFISGGAGFLPSTVTVGFAHILQRYAELQFVGRFWSYTRFEPSFMRAKVFSTVDIFPQVHSGVLTWDPFRGKSSNANVL